MYIITFTFLDSNTSEYILQKRVLNLPSCHESGLFPNLHTIVLFPYREVIEINIQRDSSITFLGLLGKIVVSRLKITMPIFTAINTNSEGILKKITQRQTNISCTYNIAK